MVIAPMRAAGGTGEGATEGMEGMAVGGKSCCLLYGDDTAHSQVSAELQLYSHK
jgi:hypothetical protein